MRKAFFKHLLITFSLIALLIEFTSFIPANKIEFCTAHVLVKNMSTTRSITKIWLVNDVSGGGFANTYNIPPGGSITPPFGNFLGNSAVGVQWSSAITSGAGGSIISNQATGQFLACGGGTNNRIIISPTWSAGCLHYVIEFYDTGNPCD